MSTLHSEAARRFNDNREKTSWHDATFWSLRQKRDNTASGLPEWERELATDNTRREAQAVQDAAETLHENFVKRAFQTDSICQLATASPHPVLV